jgi:hypothetical protein
LKQNFFFYLRPEKVKKLVYIKTNAVQMADGLLDCYENSDDNSDNEEELMAVDED